MSDTREAVASAPISISDHLFDSAGFSRLFEEGMELVEQTAAYLDGEGRDVSRDLERKASLAYATESMRLTTRLMQLASWLLLQRAVNEGEMTQEQAASEKHRVRLDRDRHYADQDTPQELPDTMKHLIERSLRLQERIKHLDRMLRSAKDQTARTQTANPVADHMSRLNAAFSTG